MMLSVNNPNVEFGESEDFGDDWPEVGGEKPDWWGKNEDRRFVDQCP